MADSITAIILPYNGLTQGSRVYRLRLRCGRFHHRLCVGQRSRQTKRREYDDEQMESHREGGEKEDGQGEGGRKDKQARRNMKMEKKKDDVKSKEENKLKRKAEIENEPKQM